MRDVTKRVERDDFMHRDGLKAEGALAAEKTMMTAGSGEDIIINPGVSLVGTVLLASEKVCFTICVGVERF